MVLATQEEGDIMDNKCFYNVTTFTQETIGESNDFKVILTNQEKLVCLREILGKLKKFFMCTIKAQKTQNIIIKFFVEES